MSTNLGSIFTKYNVIMLPECVLYMIVCTRFGSVALVSDQVGQGTTKFIDGDWIFIMKFTNAAFLN